MNSAFVLVLTVFLVSGEPVDIAVSVHRTMQVDLPLYFQTSVIT
ncbi:TPA: DUF1482 family protein, partial [Escherichia coli]|nr:DUF1482 family protein [Escherichia coli]